MCLIILEAQDQASFTLKDFIMNTKCIPLEVCAITFQNPQITLPRNDNMISTHHSELSLKKT